MIFLDLIFRILGAFITLFVVVRLLGKKQIGELMFFDYVVGLTIGTIAGAWTYNTAIPSYHFFMGIVGIGALGYLCSFIALKSKKANKILAGKPSVLIENGKIKDKNLAKNNFTMSALLQALRSKGAFNVSDVEFALLETDGSISVLKKSQSLPVTPKELNQPIEYKGLNTVLIYDGKIIKENLDKLDYSEDWLRKILADRDISDPEKIMLANLDTSGKIYFDIKKEYQRN